MQHFSSILHPVPTTIAFQFPVQPSTLPFFATYTIAQTPDSFRHVVFVSLPEIHPIISASFVRFLQLIVLSNRLLELQYFLLLQPEHAHKSVHRQLHHNEPYTSSINDPTSFPYLHQSPNDTLHEDTHFHRSSSQFHSNLQWLRSYFPKNSVILLHSHQQITKQHNLTTSNANNVHSHSDYFANRNLSQNTIPDGLQVVFQKSVVHTSVDIGIVQSLHEFLELYYEQ
mmetsp:Transcript_2855/g.5020  ORF Transcript_2855/g.5020 Transcript_2855/m.5020 type:complete len:227 (-) Transcript_2855:362-1042(-)